MRGTAKWVGLVCVLGAASCAGVSAVTSMALGVGRNLLLNSAGANFGDKYSEDFGKLVDLLLLKELNGGVSSTPSSTTSSTKTEASPLRTELTGVAVDSEAIPLQLDLTVLRERLLDGVPVPVPVEDGDLLRDGIGRDTEGDNLKLQFTAGSDCYVYAVWIDATSWATPLFPVGPGYTSANPVKAGRSYTIPEGDQWFYLDDYRGVENLYFLASREPISDLSELLVQLAGQTREFRSGAESLVLIEEPADFSRGLAGVRPGAGSRVQSSAGKPAETASQLFLAADDADQLLITRWFRHE